MKVNISERLRNVAEAVEKCNTVADIGCDHGFLPIYLVLTNRASRAIAMDLRKEPVRRAGEHIASFNLSDKITTRISNGLEALSRGEADTITITGMGGMLMRDILIAGNDKLMDGNKFVFSPQSDIDTFRKYLDDNGFVITKEKVIFEAPRFYFIINATLKRGEKMNLSDLELRFGKDFHLGDTKVLQDFLTKELYNNGILCGQLEDEERKGNLSVKPKLDYLKKEQEYRENALKMISK